MIKEVKLEKNNLDEETLKDVLAGLDTAQSGNCSCHLCGTSGNDAVHANNNPI